MAIYTLTIDKKILLASVFRVFINRLFWKNYNTTFIEDIKICQKKFITFYLFIKKNLKIVPKLILLYI